MWTFLFFESKQIKNTDSRIDQMASNLEQFVRQAIARNVAFLDQIATQTIELPQ